MFSKRFQVFAFALVTIGTLIPAAQEAEAGFYRHQYYTSWSYRPRTRYYFTRYYYHPVVRAPSYHYHYVIYYPSRPRYRYYYNPVRRVYWGRFEVDDKGKAVGYSMLKPEDQKSSLEAIPDSAFPKPSKMPNIPDAKDQEQMLPPPEVDIEKAKSAKDTREAQLSHVERFAGSP